MATGRRVCFSSYIFQTSYLSLRSRLVHSDFVYVCKVLLILGHNTNRSGQSRTYQSYPSQLFSPAGHFRSRPGIPYRRRPSHYDDHRSHGHTALSVLCSAAPRLINMIRSFIVAGYVIGASIYPIRCRLLYITISPLIGISVLEEMGALYAFSESHCEHFPVCR